jgi:hypothetical protein
LLRVRDHSGIFSLAREECTCVPSFVKPHAIDIRVNIDPVHWFLSPAKDTRSSLYRPPIYHSFRGAKWTDVKKPERRQYLKNAYRVLLTRARQGMVNLVPPGAKRDKTRSPGLYEGVCQYLTDLGVPQV